MTANFRLGSRHPNIVLIYTNEEDISCLLPLISDVSKEFKVLPESASIVKDIQQLAPHVILFALESVYKSTETYLKLAEKKVLDKNHYSILLCSNKESGLAFQSCIRKLFDNYFVFQPLYEKFRLKLIIHQGLLRCISSYHFDEKQTELLNAQDEEFTQLLEQGSQIRQHLVTTLQQSKESLPTPIETNQSDNIEQAIRNKVLKEINEQHLVPLFQQLESNISGTINTLLESLTKQHQSNLNNGKQLQHHEKKPELTHVANSEEVQKFINSLKPLAQTEENKKLLIVEDNHIYREMIASVLQKEGYNIDEAEDGLKAIKKIKSKRYAVIIMDLFMPHLDGLNTTKHIRSLNNGKNTPIIALSGNKRKELVQKWASHGLSGYIMKPSTKGEILAAVNKALYG